MNIEDIEAKVLRAVANAADRPIEMVKLDDDLYKEMRVDSLGTIAIFVELAESFSIPEPEAEGADRDLNTPRKIVAYVLRFNQ